MKALAFATRLPWVTITPLGLLRAARGELQEAQVVWRHDRRLERWRLALEDGVDEQDLLEPRLVLPQSLDDGQDRPHGDHETRTRGGDDVGEGLDVSVDTLEARAGEDGHGNDARDRCAEEGEDELVRLRQYQGEAITLSQAEGRDVRGAAVGLGLELLVPVVAFGAITPDETEAAAGPATQARKGRDECDGTLGGHGALACAGPSSGAQGRLERVGHRGGYLRGDSGGCQAYEPQ